MRLVFLSSKEYPATTANHISTRELSKAFCRVLGDNFIFTISGPKVDELKNIRTETLYRPFARFRTIFYAIQIPVIIIKNSLYKKDVWFYSNDKYLLVILIFLKSFFFCQYKICSDWHHTPNTSLAKFVANSSDALVSTTKHLKEIIVSLYKVNPDKCFVAYGGYEPERFNSVMQSKDEIRNKLNLPKDFFLVGYVGFFKTMGMDKGLDTMIKSITFIPNKNVKIVLVGGREKEIKEYVKIAEKEGVSDRVILVPSVDSSLVPLYEKAMDVLTIPYPDKPHFREQGFPLKVYEYMASGRPIIYSNFKLIAEMLGDCGYPINPSDHSALASCIEYIRLNPEEAKQKSEQAKNKVTSYSWASKAENIIGFLNRSFVKND